MCVSLHVYSLHFALHKMTTHLKLPVNDQDGVELEKIGDHVSVGSIPKPVMGSPSKKMMAKLVSGVRRLSTISEQEPDKPNPISYDSLGGSEWGGSSFSMCSDKFKNSSSLFSSDDSYQPGTGADDCAALLLACLHCRFHELMVLLLDTCERTVSRCFPSYKYIKASSERDQQGKDCCDHELDLDCNCCGSCQDAGELIELAMEISEMCYH
ncbi:myoD family inhibitor domain-containing protein 2-like isoform X2 [Siniperca chuatsi]|uniref:myoD family inhibitor domain-containing protein 2-like isoform X2 n=1 Tax=Siniperca chuatsi TaxID=119488 RepID=UPI001CE087C6|nr:myoD family inhibitor domain-containing protein 2-like isoform X2 [Siniperca chuatsi]